GADLRRAWIPRGGLVLVVRPGGAGEYARRRHRRLGRRDASRLCGAGLSGRAPKARPRAVQLEPRTVRRLHQGGVRQMGRGRKVRRYPGGLGRGQEPNQGTRTPESSHSPWVARPRIERRARDFTKLYLRDTGEKTPAPSLPLTGNTA